MDGRFAELAGLGRVEPLVRDGQPIATRLANIAHQVHRIARPHGTPAEGAAGQDEPTPNEAAAVPVPATSSGPGGGEVMGRFLAEVATGVGIAVGQRLLDTVLPRRTR